MARGQSGSPVSFFAFQDIITSVSGILIIVVLLMTLELIEQRETAASPPDPPVRPADVRAALAAAEAERDALQAELADEAAAVKAAAGASAGELRREALALKARIAALESETAEARSVAARLKEAEQALDVRRFDAAATLARGEEASRRVKELERDLDRAKRDDRPVFTLPRGFDKPGWLAVLGRSAVEAAPLGRPQRPTRIGGTADEFLNWAADHPGDYFLLVVRPSGVELFDGVNEAFRDRGVSYGYDVAGEAQAVLDPERGAAP